MDKDDKGNPDGSGWQRYFQPIVLLLLSSLLALQIPLESKRPTLEKEIPTGAGIQLDARLWMDPFDAPRQESASERPHGTQAKDFGGQIIRHAVRQREAQANAHGHAAIEFLAVMVDGGPYAESVERRRRLRYAVISALLAGHYAPEDWGHIRYLQFPNKWKLYDPQDTHRVLSFAERQMPDLIPYEWFEHPAAPDTVVLWLDENQLSVNPLAKLRILRNQFRLNAMGALLLPDCVEGPKPLLGQWLANPEIPPTARCTPGSSTSPSALAAVRTPPSSLDPNGPSLTPDQILWELLPTGWSQELSKGTAEPERAPPAVVAERNLSQETRLLQWLGPYHSGRLIWALGQKLQASGIKDAVALAEAHYHFRVLGPSSSDVLAAMLREDPVDTRHAVQDPTEPEIYSPTASVSAVALLGATVAETDTTHSTAPSGRSDDGIEHSRALENELVKQLYKRQGVCLVRTNLPDDRLAETLREELAQRDIDLARDPNQRIVLIAERDTLYGRSLTDVLKRTLAPSEEPGRIITFTYLRGLDGEGAKKETSKPGGRDKSGSGHGDANSFETFVQSVSPKSFDYAWGDDQIDYLRRISEEVEQMAQVDTQGGPPPAIRAIGLVGSDVYDKLLILRALRPRFPSAVFFTTELDARLFDGAVERDVARNLIVASSFGLRPNETVDALAPPPLRSAEQNAYFRTVRKILPGDQAAAACTVASAVKAGQGNITEDALFEIGRTRAIDLQQPNAARKPSLLGLLRLIGLLLVVVSLLWCSARHLQCPWLGGAWRRVMSVGSIFLCAGAVLYGLALLSAEPLVDPLEGVSIWPTEFLRLTAALSALWFWAAAADPAREALIHDQFARLPAAPDAPQTAATDIRRLPVDVSNTPAISAFLIAQLPFLASLCAFTALGPVLGRQGGYWLYAVPFVPFGPLGIAMVLARRRARDAGTGTDHAPRDRRTRAHLYALIILAVCSALVSLSGTPPPPARGLLSRVVDLTLLIVTVSLFIGLLGTVLESGFRLALELGRQRRALLQDMDPSAAGNDAVRGKGDAVADPAALIEAIGRSTQALFRIAFYPFIIAGLMLISRSPVFDNWPMPVGLALVFLLCFSLLIACVARIRTLADQIRTIALDQIEDPKPLERVRRCREGAYGSILSGPALGGLAILAGSGGFPDAVSKLAQLLFG